MGGIGGEADPQRTAGVLHPPPEGALRLHRLEPGPALAPYVAWFWHVEWDLEGRPAHRQATLPHPSAHLVVEDGGVWLYGVLRTRFERVLEGRGSALGVRFKPGGLRPLLPGSMAALTDRRVEPGAWLHGLDAAAYARAVLAVRGPDATASAAEHLLAPLLPRAVDPGIRQADEAVTALEHDRELLRVDALATRLGLSVRSLQRLFSEYVGVGPKWVIRRYRVQEAAAAAAAGGDVDWARLAAELGYFDQAHLVREFTAAVGVPPARYAAQAAPRG